MSDFRLSDEARAIFDAQMGVPVPQLVFNSFLNSFSASEFSSTLAFTSRPVVTIVMAPSVAKSYALALLEAVSNYERAIGQPVATVTELQEKIASSQQGLQP